MVGDPSSGFDQPHDDPFDGLARGNESPIEVRLEIDREGSKSRYKVDTGIYNILKIKRIQIMMQVWETG